MKDYLMYKADGSHIGKFRTDAMQNSPANFDINEIKDEVGKIVDYLPIYGFSTTKVFRRLPVSWGDFNSFMLSNNIQVVVQEGNGTSRTTLLSAKYSIVSATGSSKTFLVATDVTSLFTAGDVLKVYNSDGSVFGTFTHVSDSYSTPNTSIVVAETLTDIATASGKYIVNTSR